MYKKSLKIPKG